MAEQDDKPEGDEEESDKDENSGDDTQSDKTDDKGGSGDAEQKPAKPKARWPWYLAGAVVLVFVVVVLLIIFLPHADVETDDAYVTARYAMVAPRVAGQIASVAVDDNQPVHAGQLLMKIDPRDLLTALDQAEAALAADRARVAQAEAQVARQPSQIRQAAAQVASERARLGLTAADATRYANLAATGAGTFQQHQQADTNLRQQRAALMEAEANLDAQRHTRDGLIADRTAAEARVGVDEAQVRQARLNLGYTRIVAPIDGTLGQRSVQVGNFVAVGAPVMMVVPLNAAYVMANFRELELRHMRPGQRARIHLDTYAIDLDGFVQSLPPATGSTFSPIPPANATGNFTKIVQRLPVKIVVARNQPLAKLLRLGMSVEVTVHTDLDDVVGMQANSQDRVTAP